MRWSWNPWQRTEGLLERIELLEARLERTVSRLEQRMGAFEDRKRTDGLMARMTAVEHAVEDILSGKRGRGEEVDS